MPSIRPFRAVRYASSVPVNKVVCPPYDVIGPEDVSRLLATHPNNAVALTLGNADKNYAASAELFSTWIRQGVLDQSESPAYYIYLIDEPGRQTLCGIVAGLRLEKWATHPDIGIYPHEQTLPGPVRDRTNLLRGSKANYEPLWLITSQDLSPLARAGRNCSNNLLCDFVDESGTRHRLCQADPEDGNEIANALKNCSLVVADGHHRYEAALKYKASGFPGSDFAMAFITNPRTLGPRLAPIHRLISRIPTRYELGRWFQISEGTENLTQLTQSVAAGGPGTFALVSTTGNLLLKRSPDGRIDTEFLAGELLPNLHLHETVSYTHRLDEVTDHTSKGGGAILLAPIDAALVAEWAMAGRRMPPKTTLFEPKPLTGLVFRSMELDTG